MVGSAPSQVSTQQGRSSIMESVVKGMVGVAGLGFLLAVTAALMGGNISGIPAESFSRACSNLALISIALLLMDKHDQT
jgi:hypothetical protein